MAARGTEHERDVARAKLAAMDARMPPPPPPTRNGTGSTGGFHFDPQWSSSGFGTIHEVVFTGPNGERIVIRGTGNMSVNFGG